MVSNRFSVAPRSLLAFACLFLISSLHGQDAGANRSNRRGNSPGSSADSLPSPGSAGSAIIRTISGQVLNALTGNPVPRALVNLNGRAALTDPQGKFSFPAFSDANGYAQVTKPGYTASPTPEANRQQRIVNLDAFVELKLYPEAVLTGIVTGPDGLPLARTQVHLRRLTFDSTGPRWQQAGFTQTDVHGNYRFEVPAGRYNLTTGYIARSVERGETVLPVTFPASSSSAFQAFELTLGEQRQIDLRPRVGPAYPLTIALDGGNVERGTRLTATTPSGVSFPLQAQRQDDSLITQLPTGTFTLRATSGDREETLDGDARVVVTGHTTAPLAIHLAPRAIFPVEPALDATSPGFGVLTPEQIVTTMQQLNLTLHDQNSTGDGQQYDARLNIKPDHTASFQLAPGRYRLGGNQSGRWYVQSASLGVTNLLTDDLVVAPGAGASTLRLIMNNLFGRVKGTVLSGGIPASGWVYLLPEQPTLTPSVEIYVQLDGSYQWSGPVGKYIAVPSAQQVHEDFRNPAFLRKFIASGREVDIQSSADASLDLTLAPAGVAR